VLKRMSRSEALGWFEVLCASSDLRDMAPRHTGREPVLDSERVTATTLGPGDRSGESDDDSRPQGFFRHAAEGLFVAGLIAVGLVGAIFGRTWRQRIVAGSGAVIVAANRISVLTGGRSLASS